MVEVLLVAVMVLVVEEVVIAVIVVVVVAVIVVVVLVFVVVVVVVVLVVVVLEVVVLVVIVVVVAFALFEVTLVVVVAVVEFMQGLVEDIQNLSRCFRIEKSLAFSLSGFLSRASSALVNRPPEVSWENTFTQVRPGIYHIYGGSLLKRTYITKYMKRHL